MDEDEENEEFFKLAQCFDHVCRSLYRNTLEQAPLLKQLHFLTRIFLESTPGALNCPPLYLHLALLYLLSTAQSAHMRTESLPKLTSEAPFPVRCLMKTEFMKAIQALKKVK